MGDNYSHVVVETEGSYGCGPFPPCFYTRTAAEEYRAALKFKSDKRVIELRLLVLDEGEKPPPNVNIRYKHRGDPLTYSSTVPGPFDPAKFFRENTDVVSVVVQIPEDTDGGPCDLQFDRQQFKLGETK
jgi:hypothetical protein